MYCLAQLVRNSKKPPGLESRWPSLILPAFCDSVGTVRTYLAQESRNLALKIRGATGSGNARALLLGSSLVEVGSARVSGAGELLGSTFAETPGLSTAWRWAGPASLQLKSNQLLIS